MHYLFIPVHIAMGYTQRLPQIQSVGVAHLLELVSKCAGDGYVREAVDPV